MWDTWLYQDGKDYHLFFLSGGRIGRAVSQNLIDWKHLPPINNMAQEGDWDESGMRLTGCTVKHQDKYYMSYGSGEGTPIARLNRRNLKIYLEMNCRMCIILVIHQTVRSKFTHKTNCE